ncbi:MAG TPA: prepilin-type N-terminal cleavage/methylation domain-containing protein [Gaiellaceae bacterium]|nr:prepilin-type N-terminal cleavage/methylation domain-containing protein [Gaiellaceae bacterium]
MHSFRQRLAREEGFTLIELLVVLIIIGVLLAIAIPSYLGFQKSAQQTAAASDVRSAIPDVEEYYNDNNETYAGTPALTATMLRSTYDSGLLVVGVNGSTNGIATVKASTAADGSIAAGQEYCISAVDAGQWSHVAGPGGVVKTKETSDACTSWTSGPST